MTPETLTNLTESTVDIVRGVKPAHAGAPTPCAEWNVKQLANHLLQVVTALRLVREGEAIPDELWATDLMSGDMSERWAERFEREARKALATVNEKLPDETLTAMLASDLVLHGWDLARATGQAAGYDENAATLTHDFLVATGDQGREMGIYAAPVPVAATAPTLERAIGLSGRAPDWTAGVR